MSKTYIASLLFFVIASVLLQAQTNSISGIINQYTPVLVIDSCHSALVVESTKGLTIGSQVLIIQMKGATVGTANDTSYGNVTSYGNAGNYEIATIDDIFLTTVVFRYRLQRNYDAAGFVQLVTIPSYTNVTVTDTLRPKAWDGRTGGVLIFKASGTVTLQADIVADSCGFAGGGASEPAPQPHSQTGFYYPKLQQKGGLKGEGIAIINVDHEAGRGRYASGGGGGNSRGSGGGGAGNYGTGGRGGHQENADGLTTDAIGGRGGYPLLYSNTQNRIFLGGGGGGGAGGTLDGSQQYDSGKAGSRGGGIIIIQANSLVGNGNRITANGWNNVIGGYNAGAGGGGAGGVVVLDIPNYSSTVIVSVAGGHGGSTVAPICHGPGGGGSGGCIWLSVGSTPSGMTTSVVGGNAGIVDDSQATLTCLSPEFGAEAGANGSVLTNGQIPVGTVAR